MQIVRNLAGYSFGRSDLVRRAMAKKKTKVMEAERKNFVYGNGEEGVKGCIANGIDEKTANKIYDEMIDFAKYAFNKSHAAAYAVVSYQTAYLKCYYPVEFMAALLTSVKDNTAKVISYIMSSKSLGIDILPPDVNEGFSRFHVANGAIRFGMSAIKGVGEPVIEAIVAERERGGKFESMHDFMMRLTSKEINRHTIENFIKAGALDSMPGNRRQKMMVYDSMLDAVNREKKDAIAGQMSLFDMGDDDLDKANEIKYPEIDEYAKEELLGFEKEVLGIYISGHPLNDYTELMEKNCTNTSLDFMVSEDDEESSAKVEDGQNVIVGGMIADKNVKVTKSSNKLMAYIQLEDLYGTIEITIFPRDYERLKPLLTDDAKIFVRGRVQTSENRAAKLICRDIIPFDRIPCELWIRFENMEEFVDKEQELYKNLLPYDGKDLVCIYVAKEKQVKRLPKSRGVDARKLVKDDNFKFMPKEALAIREKSIEK